MFERQYGPPCRHKILMRHDLRVLLRTGFPNRSRRTGAAVDDLRCRSNLEKVKVGHLPVARPLICDPGPLPFSWSDRRRIKSVAIARGRVPVFAVRQACFLNFRRVEPQRQGEARTILMDEPNLGKHRVVADMETSCADRVDTRSSEPSNSCADQLLGDVCAQILRDQLENLSLRPAWSPVAVDEHVRRRNDHAG